MKIFVAKSQDILRSIWEITESANALRLLMLFGVVTGFFNAKKLNKSGWGPPQELLPPSPALLPPSLAQLPPSPSIL